jgi:FMN phosphatase YigB (HAD superfamily)
LSQNGSWKFQPIKSFRMTKVVIFDIGSILISDYTHLFDTHFKNSTSLPTILNANKRAWNLFKVGLLTEDQFWAEIMKNSPIKEELINGGFLHTTKSDPDTLLFLKDLVRQNLVDYPDTFAIAKKLFDIQIPLGILSNHSDEWTDYVFEAYPLFDQLFDKDIVCISSKIKCAKPEPESYQALYDTITKKYPGVEKAEVLFIDDKLANIEAAESFGLKGIHWNARKEKSSVLMEKLRNFGIKIE